MTTAEYIRSLVPEGLTQAIVSRGTLLKASDELDQRDDTITTLRAERDALNVELSAWKTSFGTQQLFHAVAERADLKAKLAHVEKERSEDKAYIEDLCKDLCKMEDVLGFAKDQRDKDGAFVPTIGPWLERVRDLISAEGELGDVKERLAHVEADAAAMRQVLEEVAEYEADEAPCIASDAKAALATGSGQRLLDELATLRATAQRRKELLRKCEWDDQETCLVCCNGVLKHKPGCPLKQELESK